MASEAKVAPPVPPPPLVTVIVAVAPVDPAMLAEIVAVPMDTAAVSYTHLDVYKRQDQAQARDHFLNKLS